MTDHATIPDELIARNQWVVWRDDKVPYNARTHRRASSTNPATWSAFDDALRALATGKYQGLGFVISENDPYVGIDLDDCRNADGTWQPWAVALVDEFESYTEITPSGRGLHIWVKGDVPAACKYIADGEHIEIYPNKRYFTVTGNTSLPSDIRPANGLLHQLYDRCTRQTLPDVAPATVDATEAYTEAALDGMLADLAAAQPSTRNINLNAKAYRLGKFVGHGLIDEQRAYDALYAAGTQMGQKPGEARRTTRSGLKAGIRDYRQLTPPERRIEPSTRTATPAAPLNADRFVNAFNLRSMEFSQPIWPIADLLSEGVTILAAPQKHKKSWLALLVGYCVATGMPFLGKYDTDPGTVLYYDLESNQRRVQQRLRAMFRRDDVWPATLWFTDECRKGDEAIAQFEADMAQHPGVKLIVVDILERIRPPRTKNGNMYEEDYAVIQALNAFAYKHQIAILVLHHTRKQKADNIFDEISGSRGITGGAGAYWVIKRVSKTDSELHIEGRDILLPEGDDEGIAMRWDEESTRFVYAGSVHTARMSDERKRAMQVLSDDKPHELREIAIGLGSTVSAASHLMKKLVADGLVDRLGRGRFARVLGVQQVQQVQDVQHVQHVQQGEVVERFSELLNGQNSTVQLDSNIIGHQKATKEVVERVERFYIEQRSRSPRFAIYSEHGKCLGFRSTYEDAVIYGKELTGDTE